MSLIFAPVVDAQVREQITGDDSPPPAKLEGPPGQPYFSHFLTLMNLLFYYWNIVFIICWDSVGFEEVGVAILHVS